MKNASLDLYKKKRDFKKTAEPKGTRRKTAKSRLRYCIQKHAASRLHYDFRLEWDGVMKSWAVPKGPSLDPRDKRLAVQVEDHPIDYRTFEGAIPAGEYGGGMVLLWDEGTWTPLGDVDKDLERGQIKFEVTGKKLKGHWVLVQMKGRGEKNWLLIKEKDEEAKPHQTFDILEKKPKSVKSGKTLEQLQKKAGLM